MKTNEITKIALLVAMNCISAYIIIPLPFSMSPLAIQTLVVNLVALLLPPKQAFWTLAIYILLGLIGVPVFTGGSAGPGKLFGPTGGYILGFLPAAVLMSIFKGDFYNFKRYCFVTLFIGIPVIYFFGLLQLSGITGMNLFDSFLIGVVPFLAGDIFKAVAASFIAKKMIEQSKF